MRKQTAYLLIFLLIGGLVLVLIGLSYLGRSPATNTVFITEDILLERCDLLASELYDHDIDGISFDWLNDSQHIVFSSDHQGIPLSIISSSDSDSKTLVESSAFEISAARDNSIISYVSSNDDELYAYAIYQIEPDATRSIPQKIADVDISRLPLESSPDGRLIAYAENGLIRIIDRSSISPNQTMGASKVDSISWHPNEMHIVFSKEFVDPADFQSSQQIYVHNIISNETEKLTAESGCVFNPRWSPSGNEIAYLYQKDRETGINIFVQSVKTDDKQQITLSGKNITSLDWSPDGDQIVYSLSSLEIYVVDLADLTQTYITTGGNPKWSPDGTQIAFISSTANGLNLESIRPDGTGHHILYDSSR